VNPEERKSRVITGLRVVAVATVVLAASPAFAQGGEAAGRIKIVAGSVAVVRGGADVPAQVGQPVFETDILRTGQDGRVGLTLKDDTRVSLGPASELRIDAFRFAPGEGRFALVLRFVRGVAGYISGRLAKLAPDAVRLETPAAIVGVRGTTVAIRVTP
jgi:hypothetical protein